MNAAKSILIVDAHKLASPVLVTPSRYRGRGWIGNLIDRNSGKSRLHHIAPSVRTKFGMDEKVFWADRRIAVITLRKAGAVSTQTTNDDRNGKAETSVGREDPSTFLQSTNWMINVLECVPNAGQGQMNFSAKGNARMSTSGKSPRT